MSKLKKPRLTAEVQAKLQDLGPELSEITIDREDCFYRYYEPSMIGGAILDEFLAFNRDKEKKGAYKFVFSDDLRKTGIIPLLQSFQTVTMLSESFDADIKECVDLNSLLDEIFNEVYQDGEFVFRSSPHLEGTGFFNKDYAYIDTVTWFISAMLSVFRLMISGKYEFTEENQKLAKLGFVRCINYLLDSFVGADADADASADRFSCGWNYTKDCEEPSLYFTFSVSEVLIDILETFNNVIRSADADYLKNRIDELIGSGELALPYEEKNAKFEQIDAQFEEFRNNLATTEGQMEGELFKEVNQEKAVYETGSPYAKLEELCKKAANQIWRIVNREDLGDLINDFFSYNLSSVVKEDSITESVSNNALFNKLFVLNIAINAGVDEDAEDKVNYFTPNGSDKYEAALSEYDAIRNKIRLAYDSVYMFYNDMVKKNMDHKVNEYILPFDERFDIHKKEIGELRRARIRIFSLEPLLVKTKTVMSDFVIQYPQYDMQIYLENILKSRLKNDKGEPLWIWEKNGYSSSANYYYVEALSSFFDYYDKYESNFIKNSNENDKAKERIRKEYLKELKQKGQPIWELEREKAELNEKLKELKAEKDGQIEELKKDNLRLLERIEALDHDPFRETMRNFVVSIIEESLSTILRQTAEAVRVKAQSELKLVEAAEEPKGEYKDIADSVKTLVRAFVSKPLYLAAHDDDDTRDAIKDEKKNAERVAKDVNELLRIYFRPIISKEKSVYVANNGYLVDPGIRDDILRLKNANPSIFPPKKNSNE